MKTPYITALDACRLLIHWERTKHLGLKEYIPSEMIKYEETKKTTRINNKRTEIR
jgi:hypothetical protein